MNGDNKIELFSGGSFLVYINGHKIHTFEEVLMHLKAVYAYTLL